ncbi:DUF333 domain-containing protein [Mesorhizobium sp. BR115XR7A]|uniref:putative hemolysin n=1 Tax=Mesorhizobium sp. BR115XR7A TaxID=2876645 RepID=UPI001CCA5F1B|nr:DUF333 domain-containing protein [Mesorhizobium sp. BR115XR7A]MBZ9906188.1 DUF333 domain-containing protein [Mesorhizobium sp. BR115XR7A]MBZ9933227.1 DUF333 domain-containing protein [Mesorhizobium sp. BR1-1-5]
MIVSALRKQVGTANPASVHCAAIDGRLTIKEDKAGNGFCHLPNGRLCEEWALFRDNRCVGPSCIGIEAQTSVGRSRKPCLAVWSMTWRATMIG